MVFLNPEMTVRYQSDNIRSLQAKGDENCLWGNIKLNIWHTERSVSVFGRQLLYKHPTALQVVIFDTNDTGNSLGDDSWVQAGGLLPIDFIQINEQPRPI